MLTRIQLIFFISITFSLPILAQWKQTGGPEGGFTGQLARIDSIIFVTTQNGGIYKSSDGGITWSPSNQGIPEDPYVPAIKARNEKIYASVSPGGMFVSDDLAETWTPINAGIEYALFYNFIVGESGKIYAASAFGGIYYSPDSGMTWLNKSDGISSLIFKDFAFFNSRIYAASDKLYESSNDGDSWQEIDIPGLDVNGIWSMIVNKNIFYVCTSQDIYISEDSLKTWTKSSLTTPGTNVSMGLQNDTVYLTTGNGSIYYTTSNGQSWRTIQNNLYSGLTLNALFLNNNIVMSTAEGIYTSNDNGSSWLIGNTGLRTIWIKALAKNDTGIFAGSESLGMYRSKNNGVTWDRINEGLNAPNSKGIYDIVFIGGEIFVGTGGGLYSSDDQGDHWVNRLSPGVNKGVNALAYDEIGGLAAAVSGDGIYISTDTAASWNLIGTSGLNTGSGYTSLIIRGDTLIVGTNNSEVFMTTNKGTLWNNITIDQTSFYLVNKLRYVNGVLYAATSKGLYISADLGSQWENVNSSSVEYTDVLLSSTKIYAATSKGILTTSLSRDEWYDVSMGLETKNMTRLLMDSDKIYAGTYASSVWERDRTELNISPLITDSQSLISVNEDSSFIITFDNIVVDDPDNDYPTGFTLTIQSDENYSLNGDTITPVENFNGMLNIPVTVNDGMAESPVYNLSVEIIPVNDPPVIHGVNVSLSTEEVTPIEITLQDFNVTDVDNDSSDFTLIVGEGDNYSVEGNTVVPDENFTGTITVPVSVSDGDTISNIYNLTIEVTSVTGISLVNNERHILLYPNPVKNFVTVNFQNEKPQPVILDIFNTNGISVLHKSTFAVKVHSSEVLNVGDLRPGIYIVRLLYSSVNANYSRLIIKSEN